MVGSPKSQPSNRVFHEQAQVVMTVRNGRVLGTPEQNSLAEDSEKEMSPDPSPEAPQASKDDEIKKVEGGSMGV